MPLFKRKGMSIKEAKELAKKYADVESVKATRRRSMQRVRQGASHMDCGCSAQSTIHNCKSLKGKKVGGR